MENLISRYRNVIFLVAILFVQVLGLAVQVKRRSGEGEPTRLIRVWAVGAVTPLEKAIVWAQNGARQYLAQLLLPARRAAGKSRPEGEIERMRLEQVRLVRRRRSGAPSAGVAGLQGTVHFEDRGGAGHRFQRQRAVAVDLHRQGHFGRDRQRHGGHYRGRHRGQGAAGVRPRRRCS